jgi:hypothetical protein
VLALGFVAKGSFDWKQTTRTREGGKARSEWGASQAAVECGRAPHENQGQASSAPADYGSPTPVLIASVITAHRCLKLRLLIDQSEPQMRVFTGLALPANRPGEALGRGPNKYALHIFCRRGSRLRQPDRLRLFCWWAAGQVKSNPSGGCG